MKSYSKTKWSVWGILTLSFVLVLFLRMSTAVISDNLSSELGFNSVQVSNIASFTLYAYAFMQIPAGLLIDKYGARKVSSIGIIIASIGSILFSIMQNISIAYISRIMVGAGTSVILLSIFKIQGSWFKQEEFSSATTKFSFIGNLGSVFATFPLVFLNDFIGWRSSFLLIGIIGLVIGVFIYTIVKNSPKEYGFDIELESEVVEKINLKEGIKSVIKNKSTWYNSLILFSLVGVSTAFASLWGVQYIVDIYGVSKNISAFIISFLTYGFVCGSIIMNVLFSKIKTSKFNIIIIGASINVILWTFIIVICDMKPPIGLLPILFFIIGCINMSHLQAFNDVKYKNSAIYSGLSTSIVNTSEFLGSGLINLFIAFIIQLNSSNLIIGYKLGFMIFIIMNIITIIAAYSGVRNDSPKMIESIN
ncbi:MAG: MFS transporter [Romboutsia sp.]